MFDGNNKWVISTTEKSNTDHLRLWGVENSSDDMRRTVNGVTTDIHNDNPAEELNYLGDVSVPNPKWYGYPMCFTVWSPSFITDAQFTRGSQIVMTPSSTFNDACCIESSTPPRLNFPAHSAPLDSQFDSSFSTLYVSFHGSWNRNPPAGFKLVAIPFSQRSNSGFAPTAAANSDSGFTNIFWNNVSISCSATNCFRPVGIAVDSTDKIFLTSDSSAEGGAFLLGKV